MHLIPLLMYKERYKVKEWLENKYRVQKWSIRKIAREEGVNAETIRNWLIKFGIERRHQAINHVTLSETALSFLNGELLGDASLIWGCEGISAYYSITSKHKEYLDWLRKKLFDFGLQKVDKIRKYKNSWGYYFLLQTKYYRELSVLRKLWYPNGIKIVPKELKLNPLTTKMWFIEDGSAFIRSSGKKAINFCTNSFKKEDVERLAQMLRNELNLEEIYVNKAHGRGYLIVINKSNVISALFDYIGDCPEELKNIYGYKWILNNEQCI